MSLTHQTTELVSLTHQHPASIEIIRKSDYVLFHNQTMFSFKIRLERLYSVRRLGFRRLYTVRRLGFRFQLEKLERIAIKHDCYLGRRIAVRLPEARFLAGSCVPGLLSLGRPSVQVPSDGMTCRPVDLSRPVVRPRRLHWHSNHEAPDVAAAYGVIARAVVGPPIYPIRRNKF